MLHAPLSGFSEDGRPLTIAITQPIFPKPVLKPVVQSDGITGYKIRIEILATWGDAYYTGLTGVEVLGPDGQMLRNFQLTAQPQDMNVIPGYSGDYRTLDKVINGQNQTTDDRNMWLIPFCPGQQHYIDINLQKTTKITGLRFWNYNKSDEDTYRGIKNVRILVDNTLATVESGIVLRKAPGNAQIDFG
jgi:hypothetical protein